MMTYEIGMTDPSDSSPAIDGLVTFLSFVTFGSIPLEGAMPFTASPQTPSFANQR